ncbi:hypothetical protein [Methylobacillus sp.]|uniref:hypothetical protein n=1 Tax=Methylobacillus sp. TaxID=56818 RepID=UPI0012CA9476|nr:hypothetical protein [Methylobacillus sp.]MPS48511.1 hypothetical protein [Methylobacillus sp.]
MKISEYFALGNALSSFDETKTYEEVLEDVEEHFASDEDSTVVIYHPFEGTDASIITEHIENERIIYERIIAVTGGVDKEYNVTDFDIASTN